MENVSLDSAIQPEGKLSIVVRDKDGNIKSETNIKNTITSAGRTFIADQLKKVPTQQKMDNMGIGTGSPSATALGTEISRRTFVSSTSSGAVLTVVAHWDNDDEVSGSITEAGIFNSGSLGGTMLCSATFAAITKNSQDSLDITWTVTIK